MAETDISPTELVTNVASADIGPFGIVATTPGDGFNIKAGGLARHRLTLIFTADASGDTVTIVAGAKPPAETAGLGDLEITLAASDSKAIVVEGARFLRADGTILATAVDAGTLCMALLGPA